MGSQNRRNFDDDAPEYDYDASYDSQIGESPGLLNAPPPAPERTPSRQSFRQRKPSFHPNSLLRDPPRGTGNPSGSQACKSGARTVAHESQCDLYYECYEGQGFLQSCPNGLNYKVSGRHGLIGVCDYPHNTNCREREERNPPQSTEHCDWLYGIFGHETSCTRYWTCWNGTATEQFCIGGLLYNEETHACDWPQNVAGCQKHPLCKDDANGNVPLGKSCNRYWACQGGYPRLQRCPAMLVFDKNRKRCVSPPTEDCEVPTTREPPTDGRDDGSGNSAPRSANPRRGGGGRRQQPRQPQEERRQPQEDRRQPQSQQRNEDLRPQRQTLEQSQPQQLPFSIPGGAIPFNN